MSLIECLRENQAKSNIVSGWSDSDFLHIWKFCTIYHIIWGDKLIFGIHTRFHVFLRHPIFGPFWPLGRYLYWIIVKKHAHFRWSYLHCKRLKWWGLFKILSSMSSIFTFYSRFTVKMEFYHLATRWQHTTEFTNIGMK